MLSGFHAQCPILDHAIDELFARHRTYLSCREVFLEKSDVDRMLYILDPDISISPVQFNTAIDYIQTRGVRIKLGSSFGSPLSKMLAASIADELYVNLGKISFSSTPRLKTTMPSLVEGKFNVKIFADGRYWISSRGQRYLFVINSLGIPLMTWERLLNDTDHEFCVVILEPNCCDVIAGGMKNAGSIYQDASFIKKVIEIEECEDVSIVAWSNACSVAIESAILAPSKISKVILVCPAFPLYEGMPDLRTNFQASIDQLLMRDTAASDGVTLTDKLIEQLTFLQYKDRPKLANEVAENILLSEESYLSLPRPATVSGFLAPFAPVSIRAFISRYRSDQKYPIVNSLSKITQSVLVITGSADNIVSNEHTQHILKKSGVQFTLARVYAGGHYIHDLQYLQFKYLVESFCKLPGQLNPAARIAIRTSA